METVTETIEISAPQAEIFALTQDYGRRLEWDRYLKQASLLDGAPHPKVGVRALCVSRYGQGLEVEYVS